MATLYVVSTPVAPLGHPSAGGVNQMLSDIVDCLSRHVREVVVLAPVGSVFPHAPSNVTVKTLEGTLSIAAQAFPRKASEGGVLQNMLDYLKQHGRDTDVVINLSYDAAAFDQLTALTRVRVFHYITSSIGFEETVRSIRKSYHQKPDNIACQSHAQAQFLGILGARVIPLGIDISKYRFYETPDALLGWAGRISPEKDVLTPMRIAFELSMRLRVMGAVQDEAYWQRCRAQYPLLDIELTGFLSIDRLQTAIGSCAAFLMTSRSDRQWQEAFGIVALIALACGVPVVTLPGGGPSEIVEDGVSGILVREDGWSAATMQALKLSRADCRKRAEHQYSMKNFQQKLTGWIL